MKETRILFTGVGRRIELLQAFRQAALVSGKTLKIYGADMAGTAPALAYCDFTRKVCSMKDPGYIDELVEICKKDRIDILIPTIDTDLLVLAKNKEKIIETGTRVLISDLDKIMICRDKNNTSAFFVECGLLAPMPVNDIDEYKMGFPAFIKPKDGSSSINAFKVDSQEELEAYSKQVEDYIIQPFISGKEYTIDIFCDFDGNPISVVPRERMQVRAGEVLKTKIFMDEVMIREAHQICEKFKPCGPITVQLIRSDADGKDYFIEINPRFGGGAPLSIKAGAKSPSYILELLDGGNNFDHTQIEDGAIYSRFDQSVCIEPGDRKVKGVIFDLDDTLYSEKEYVKSGFKAVASFLGNEEYADTLYRYFEEGKPAIDELLKEISREGEKDAVLEAYRGQTPDIHLYDGVLDIIKGLKEKGIRIGLITDGRPEGQKKKIAALGIGNLFDDIIITDELGGVQFRKPCDISFRIMRTRWCLPYEEIVYIGDNASKDFQAAGQLGMRGIFFDNQDSLYSEFGKHFNSGIRRITSLKELKEIL